MLIYSGLMVWVAVCVLIGTYLLASHLLTLAAPLLVIVDPGDTVRYVGGYTPRKQAADVRDLAVIAAVQRGETVEPLPTFGCAIGRASNSRLDPLGIRRN